MLSDPAIVIVAGNVSAGIIAFMTALYFSKRKEAREVYLNNIAFGEKLCDELYTRCIAYWGTDKTAAIQITNQTAKPLTSPLLRCPEPQNK